MTDDSCRFLRQCISALFLVIILAACDFDPSDPVPPVVDVTPQVPMFTTAATMVSGTAGYGSGSWTYTDYVYDDSGAGGFDYPAGSPHNENSADAVLFSVSLTESAVRYTMRLNTLIESNSTVFAIAVDSDNRSDTGGGDWPYNAKLSSAGWDHLITAWGDSATVSFPDGRVATVAIVVDLVTNTIDVDVPFTIADPDRGIWRLRSAVGLWDAGTSLWREVLVLSADESAPSGKSDVSLPNAFNLLFRNRTWDGGTALTDENDSDSFQSARQEAALSAGDIARFFRDVDFGLITDRVTQAPPHPQADEQLTRIYESVATSNTYMEGRNFPPVGQASDRRIYNGLFQPYILFVPGSYWEAEQAPAPLAPMLHGWLGDHRSFNPADDDYWQLVRDQRVLVPKPLGRGEEVWYEHLGELDVLEVIEDVRRHYKVDGDRIYLAGTSMGGLGTLKVAAAHPDIFAGIYASVPPLSDRTHGYVVPESNEWDLKLVADSLRNVPTQVFAGTIDAVVPAGVDPEKFCIRLRELKYDHDCWRDLLGQHASYDAARASEIADLFLNHRRIENPSHVVYANEEAFRRQAFEAGIGKFLSYDRVYWVSGIRYPDALVDPEFPPSEPIDTSLEREPSDVGGLGRRLSDGNRISRIDIRSYGNGDGEPVVREFSETPIERQDSLVRHGMEVTAGEAIPLKNGFDMTLTLIDGLDLDLGRMNLSAMNLTANMSVGVEQDVALGLLIGGTVTVCQAMLGGLPLDVVVSGQRLELVVPLTSEAQAFALDCQI
jgi:pimeloyl-ACP methyl ester carboxylesterase